MEDTSGELGVPEDQSRLVIIEHESRKLDVTPIVNSLRQDFVVLIRNVDPERADNVIYDVAHGLGLSDSLESQAAFAGFYGHRQNIGKYFMSVNKRGDYQFITPHSEGTSFLGIQIAAFYCYENSTDGGETILMNVNEASTAWQSVREKVKRAKLGNRTLAKHEIVRARGLYQLELPSAMLRDDDQILHQYETEIPGLTVVEVLAKPQKTYSVLLNRKINVYWDSIESTDFDSANEFGRLLMKCGLLKQPVGGLDLSLMDADAHRRIWHSGIDYVQLFNCKVTRKLAPTDLVIHNNLSWTHAASNWSPRSGNRKTAASFA